MVESPETPARAADSQAGVQSETPIAGEATRQHRRYQFRRLDLLPHLAQ